MSFVKKKIKIETETKKEEEIVIYTDGSCLLNGMVDKPPGGWAWLSIKENGKEIVKNHNSGSCSGTTNNRMEMTAVIEGLKSIEKNEYSSVVVVTDSKYVKDGIEQWLDKWIKNGWRTSKRLPVKNKDLWEILSKMLFPELKWRWIKGHSSKMEGYEHNDFVDKLARSEATSLIKKSK